MKNLGFLNSLLYYTVQSSLRLQGNDHEFAITFFSYLKPGYTWHNRKQLLFQCQLKLYIA